MTTTVEAGAQAPAAGPTGRAAELLTAIRRQGGRWGTTRAVRLYRRLTITAAIADTKLRQVAQGDLRDLHAWGYLTLHDEPSSRHYTLATRKDRTK